jgi:hypothetical protein
VKESLQRPINLLVFKTNIIFNNDLYDELEFDIEHINQGRNKARKNNLSEKEVIRITKVLLDNDLLDSVGFKDYDKASCTYYVKTGIFETKKYKIVFCVCTDRPNSLGIITLFRNGGMYESI